MAFVPRFLRYPGYETIDHQTSTRDSVVYVDLKPVPGKPLRCRKCASPLAQARGQHRLRLRDLPLRGFDTIVRLWRRKGFCPSCKKVRGEEISFLAKESPHVTQDYAWWIGKMCEFAPVSRVAEMVGEAKMTVRRLDEKRMRRMLRHYRIPDVSHIAVDEVYARRKMRHRDEDRDQRFFTVITDLNTRKVIWVSQSRKRSALDEFFALIGADACARIEVVAMDQHEPYRASVAEHCKSAKVVWDKFHVLKIFEEAVNETRKTLHSYAPTSSPVAKLTRGKYRFAFLKKASRRDEAERRHIDDVVAANQDFMALELIKERMLTFFDSTDERSAWECLQEIGRWIGEKMTTDRATAFAFDPMRRWWARLTSEWQTLKNYFAFPVTSALAEGINNVIKALKRRSFGFRNMEYFRLKIMQACGYLNSRHIKFAEELGT